MIQPAARISSPLQVRSSFIINVMNSCLTKITSVRGGVGGFSEQVGFIRCRRLPRHRPTFPIDIYAATLSWRRHTPEGRISQPRHVCKMGASRHRHQYPIVRTLTWDRAAICWRVFNSWGSGVTEVSAAAATGLDLAAWSAFFKCSDCGVFLPAFKFLRDESRAKPKRAPFEGAGVTGDLVFSDSFISRCKSRTHFPP